MTKPENATELIGLANDRFCLNVADLADLRKLGKEPWKWKRAAHVPIAERRIEMTRGEAVKAAFVRTAREKVLEEFGIDLERKIEMIGNAKFVYDEKQQRLARLEFSDSVQPHNEDEHDLMAAIVKDRGDRIVPVKLVMENGTLKVAFTIAVPAFERDPETQRIVLSRDAAEKRRASEEAVRASSTAGSAGEGKPGTHERK